ncbi:hypothetical protein [Alkalinema sp. FACHB-956]|uniref:hypothetical protein n=1 Tax=Alkalinema sp. FACHB-956 TaxID=2692768 RepID=UPI001689F25B|nr:hypothetical protein [Alkalinema sp. FACHB-956]MBD2329684.1 hypothetical protein [Alkalinema sp. FACHB-956]
MTSSKRKSVLGTNPLAVAPLDKGIFQKTETGNQTPEIGNQEDSQTASGEEIESGIQNPESRNQKLETRNWKPETGFLAESRELEKITLRLPIELNDWLDDLLKQGKRKHGQKIPKEVWVQAAIELLKAMPVDWTEVKSIEQMREKLSFLESSYQNPESGK